MWERIVEVLKMVYSSCQFTKHGTSTKIRGALKCLALHGIFLGLSNLPIGGKGL
jgi:hypothetical protein